MARYLLVDETDGSVVAKLASRQLAIRLRDRLARQPDGGPPVSLVRIDDQDSDLTEATSIVSVRPLASLVQPRAKAPSERLPAHRSPAHPRLAMDRPSAPPE